MRGEWIEPLEIEFGNTGKFRVVADTKTAAEFLLHRWPVNSGKAYINAKRTCIDVLGGVSDPEEARRAFVQASEEAGLRVRLSQRYPVKGLRN